MVSGCNPIRTGYIGRFAPSPTGPLHIGSLLTATASYLDARANQGKWLVRMEDLDRPRVSKEAADDILRTLTAFGFEWDGDILYQSQRDEIYQVYAEKLRQAGLLYPCGCSRKEIESLAHAGIEGPRYPGTCRNGLSTDKLPRSWRIKVSHRKLGFNDLIQGHIQHDLTNDIGDFVLKRADGLFAYQLAVVVDDAEQGITHIVRGADLLNSTTRQIYLQQQFQFTTPCYAHIPIITNVDGVKLSTQNKAPMISERNKAEKVLTQALTMLGLSPPAELEQQEIAEIWHWAIANWHVDKVSKTRSIPIQC